jgi:hypothetical protein
MSVVTRWSRFAFNLVAWLFVGCVVVQVYLAGLGVFDRPESFLTHRDFGYLFGLLTLVMLVLAFVGRLARWQIGASALLLVLFALQSVFIALRESTPAAAALHPLNGFLILAIAVILAWKTRGYLRSGQDEEATAE